MADILTLEKESLSYRTIASRLLHCDCDDFPVLLKKFLFATKELSLYASIFDFSVIESYDIDSVLAKISSSGLAFGVSDRDEASGIYAFLVGIDNKQLSIRNLALSLYGHSKFQEDLDEFLSKIVQPLVSYVANQYMFEIRALKQSDTTALNQSGTIIHGDNYGSISTAIASSNGYAVSDSEMNGFEPLKEIIAILERQERTDEVESAFAATEIIQDEMGSAQPRKSKLKMALGVLDGVADLVQISSALPALKAFLMPLIC